MLQVGKVLKSHGVEGEILVGVRDLAPEDINIGEPVFVEFDGLPVPFFIRSFRQRGNDKAILAFEDVATLEDAEELVGRALWMEEDLFEDDEEESFEDFVGWTVQGVGPVTAFLDIPANPSLEVETPDGPVILPLHEDLILSLDPDRRVLELSIPEGLLG